MPSESVWFPQVNNAFSKLVKEKLPTIKDVIPLKPETEFWTKQEFPCVRLLPITFGFETARYNQGTVVISTDTTNNTAVVEDSPEPYSLDIQFEIWSKFQLECDTLVFDWLKIAPKRFYLDVLDMSGNVKQCAVTTLEKFKSGNFIRGNDRLFRYFVTYRVSVAIDEREQRTVNMVGSPEFNLESK